MLYSGEQILSFKPCLVFYAGDSLNAQMLHFPLGRELVLGMPRIEIEFEVDMVFCFDMRLAPSAVFFSTRIYLQHIARPVESDRPINIVFVHQFFRSQFMNVGP